MKKIRSDVKLNNKEVLKLYLGQLKYQKKKMIYAIELIDDYIGRIEENISEIKCEDTYIDEEYKNKDLKREVEELLRELKDSDIK